MRRPSGGRGVAAWIPTLTVSHKATATQPRAEREIRDKPKKLGQGANVIYVARQCTNVGTGRAKPRAFVTCVSAPWQQASLPAVLWWRRRPCLPEYVRRS